MRDLLATKTLKTGEVLRIECVLPPDAEREHQIAPFLGHKPNEYRFHITESFAGSCDDLETRYYVGFLGGDGGGDEIMVGNIMTVEQNGVGILGHVHTRDDQRRKGICTTIMDYQMADFAGRGGQILLLGTGFESAPYWIYHRHGFRDLPGARPGMMWFQGENSAAFLPQFYAPDAPARIVPMAWKHWPLVALLAALPSPVTLRSMALGAWGVSLLEGPYTAFLQKWGANPRAAALAREADTGAVTAVVTRIPHALWLDILLLDTLAHPETPPDALAELIEALPPVTDTRKVVCYADPNDTAKREALTRTGFAPEAVLPRQFRANGEWRDALGFSRHYAATSASDEKW